MSTGDAAIDAAFSSAPDSQTADSSTGDPVIDAAFAKSAPAAAPARNPYAGLPEDMNPEVTEGQGQQLKAAPTVFKQLLGGFLDASAKGSGETAAQAAQRTQKLGLGATNNPIEQSVRMVGGFGALTPVPEGEAAAPLTAEQILTRQALKSPQSMGAAAAAPQLQNASPELKQAIVDAAQKNGGAVNPQTLNRHLEADSLPVKMQLTEGQASQDPNVLSNEVNSRAKNPALSQRYNDQNSQLAQNVQSIRDQVGPDVFTTNQVEHGDTLIQAYKDKDAAVQADINQKYQALRDANGATMPIDTGTLVSNVDAQLKKQYLTDSVPPQAQSILNSLRSGEPMDFEGFEAARSRLAEAQRNGGSEAKAAGIIRNNLEQMPLQPQAAGLKDLADTARSAAKARFDALEADPAYNAAVNDTVPPDRFTSRYVINGNRDDVGLMKQNLADNDVAQQTIGVSALDHLRDQARVGPGQSGNFAADTYNKALTALGPKGLVDPQTAEQLSTLGNVAKYVKGQPSGSYVNNSNTFTALAGEHAKSAVEGAVNVAAHGIPVGTWIRKAAQSRAQAAETQRALAPGAGISRLSDVGKP